jgi:DNA polymerase I
MAFDYSQIELRLAAHMSGDEKMIKAFRDGIDIHIATAALINGVSIEAVTPNMRREAKAVNFGILYGQGPHGLSQGADIPFKQAKEFIDNYFKEYSGVKNYLEKTIEEAKVSGYVETMFGRRRYLPEINSNIAMVKKAAERMAVNTPLQGSAADIIKIAMIKINEQVLSGDIRMLLQVHDELVFEVRQGQEETAYTKIKKIMEEAASLKVAMSVEVKSGKIGGK